MSEWLGVELWPGRRPAVRKHRVADFPMLRHQVRCETGFKHCPGGVFRLSNAPTADDEADERLTDLVDGAGQAEGLGGLDEDLRGCTVHMFRLLRSLADGGVLPRNAELGTLIAPAAQRMHVANIALMALKALAKRGRIALWRGERVPGSNELPLAVRLADGRVLRNAQAAKLGIVWP